MTKSQVAFSVFTAVALATTGCWIFSPMLVETAPAKNILDTTRSGGVPAHEYSAAELVDPARPKPTAFIRSARDGQKPPMNGEILSPSQSQGGTATSLPSEVPMAAAMGTRADVSGKAAPLDAPLGTNSANGTFVQSDGNIMRLSTGKYRAN